MTKMKIEAEKTNCFDCNTNYIDNSALNVHLLIEHNHAAKWDDSESKFKTEKDVDELIDKKPGIDEEILSVKNEPFENSERKSRRNPTSIKEINEQNHFGVEHNLAKSKGLKRKIKTEKDANKSFDQNTLVITKGSIF